MARILLADDDAASLEVMTTALQSLGHDVLCAANGLEAFETAVAEQPDLVFLDIMMPIFDGYEVCERLRKSPDVDTRLPIVFLRSADTDTRKLEEVGATDQLPKRHMVAELRELLSKHLPEG